MRRLLRAALLASALAMSAGPLSAQSPPDLEGVWTNVTLTPFERPAALAGRKALNEAEAVRLESEAAAGVEYELQPTDPAVGAEDHTRKNCQGAAGRDCGYNNFWKDPAVRVMRVRGEPRSSIVTFPADGQIPYRARPPREPAGFDNPEDRSLPERCLESQNIRHGALMVSTLYNNTYEIVQSPDAVAIVVEMSHDARIIRLNGEHGATPKWFGDSVGRYEGGALVVETTNFHPLQVGPSGRGLKVTERFTRVAPDRLLYQFRVEDPATYAEPWGGEYEFSPSPGPLYEYACHEGNRGLENILSGARFEESQARGGASAGTSR